MAEAGASAHPAAALLLGGRTSSLPKRGTASVLAGEGESGGSQRDWRRCEAAGPAGAGEAGAPLALPSCATCCCASHGGTFLACGRCRSAAPVALPGPAVAERPRPIETSDRGCCCAAAGLAVLAEEGGGVPAAVSSRPRTAARPAGTATCSLPLVMPARKTRPCDLDHKDHRAAGSKPLHMLLQAMAT